VAKVLAAMRIRRYASWQTACCFLRHPPLARPAVHRTFEDIVDSVCRTLIQQQFQINMQSDLKTQMQDRRYAVIA
jgi:hypothetical protein